MARVRTLDPRTSLSTLLVEIRYTLSQLRAHPLAATHAPRFENLRTECMQVHAEDLALLENQADAQAVVDVTNDGIDVEATRFSRVLLTITGENRKHALYRFYFGEKTLPEFKRPILSTQLKAMRAWIPSLQTADPALQALGPALTAAVEAGEQAAQGKEDAVRLRREFRDIGARRVFIDRLNIARKEVHGALSALPHEHTHLPSNFADQFFRRDPGRDDVEEEEETEESLLAHIEALHGDIAATEERLAELRAQAEAEAKAAAERAASEAAVAELDRMVAEMQAKRAAIAATLEER